MSSNIAKPIVTIGLPVYNGEKFIEKCLSSILNQTRTDFILIISDNASEDKTAEICKEFLENDTRIKYFKQEKNIGILENFYFILNESKSPYFVWIAVDDFWQKDFLEKNIDELLNNKKYVGSISKIDYYDIEKNTYEVNATRSKIKKYHSYDKYPKFGKYIDRVSYYLRLNRAENVYALFKTDLLKKCIEKPTIGVDLKILLNILKYGEINVLDEILMKRSGKGKSSRYSSKNILTLFNDYGILGKIFPFLSFSIWVFKNLGPRVFFKNLDYLLLINGAATKYQIKHGFK